MGTGLVVLVPVQLLLKSFTMEYHSRSLVFLVLVSVIIASSARPNTKIELTVPVCKSDGYFQYFEDCHKFIQCSCGLPYIMSCQNGTVWSQQELTCDWDWKVPCEERPS